MAYRKEQLGKVLADIPPLHQVNHLIVTLKVFHCYTNEAEASFIPLVMHFNTSIEI